MSAATKAQMQIMRILNIEQLIIPYRDERNHDDDEDVAKLEDIVGFSQGY